MEDLFNSYLNDLNTDITTVSPGTSVTLPASGSGTTSSSTGIFSSLFGFLGGIAPVVGQVYTSSQAASAQKAASQLQSATAVNKSSSTTMIIVIVAAVVGVIGLMFFLKK